MQSVLRQGAGAVSNPLLGNRMTYRVAPVAAPTSSSTATRQVTTMAKKKGVRIIVTLECTEARGLGETPSRYCTQKVGWAVSAIARAAACARYCCCATAAHTPGRRCREETSGLNSRAWGGPCVC
jgi:hypothetical protein